MKVKFWGTRGSVPVPGPSTLRYGGNTSCVEVRTQAGTLLILDSGTGIRALGEALLAQSAEADTSIQAHILLGHTHWDHIQGFPFFLPVFMPGNIFTIYAPDNSDKSLENVLAGQMSYTYFPVTLDQLLGKITFEDLHEGTFNIADVLVTAQPLNHPAPSLGYRIAASGSTVVYSSDHEPFGGRSNLADPKDQRHLEFVADADLLIHDAQYTEDEYQTKVGWGHSPLAYVVDLAIEGNVRRLALFHHDPTHNDTFIDGMVEQCRRRVAAHQGASLDVFAAAEGLEVNLAEVSGFAVHGVGPKEVRLFDHQPRVLIVNADPTGVATLKDILVEDHYVVYAASTPQDAVEMAQEEHPDLVLWDLATASSSDTRFCRAIRSMPQLRDLPVIAITPEPRTVRVGTARASFTHVIAHPFDSAEVRTAVREWLLGRHAGDGRQPSRPTARSSS